MSLIEVKNLSRLFGNGNLKKALKLRHSGHSRSEILQETSINVAVDNVTLLIEENEIFVIMGLSGSGKSTLLRCLNRLIEPTEGTVLIDGVDLLKLSKQQVREIRRNKISMVFQNFGLFPVRTVIENVEFGLEIRGMKREKRRSVARKTLDLVGLSDYADSDIHELSGGMQQRVGLARALATDAEILLMDEAFSALDPIIRSGMQDELIDLQSRMARTIVFITHDLDEALKLGDRIAIMRDGQIIQIGSPEQILTDPADDYVHSFVKNVDRSKVITAGSVMIPTETVTVPRDGPNQAIRMMRNNGISTIFVTDKHRRLMGVITLEDAIRLKKRDIDSIDKIINTEVESAREDTKLTDLFIPASKERLPIPVINNEGKMIGIVRNSDIISGMAG